MVLALAVLGCAAARPSDLMPTEPLRGQPATRVLVDRDDCDRSGGYVGCMIARGYAVDVEVETRVPRRWGTEPAVVRSRYTFAAEGVVTAAEAATALAECIKATEAALVESGVRVTTVTTEVGFGVWGTGLLLLPVAAVEEARARAVIDRAFPLCLARRGLSAQAR
ncbi:MAG: hypothetical protein HY553_16690 [Elusimicrobia bacterium]|nr:hypothetical protein [Elusimicrobiota bacterium]